MNEKKRVKIGNSMSKLLARLDHSDRKGSVEEAVLRGDFFTDDYEKKTPAKEETAPSAPRRRGRPRKHPQQEPPKTSTRVPGVYRSGKTLKTRVQVNNQRVQVDLKTDKWDVARVRKGQIDGMLFEGKFFGKCPPISIKNAWEQFKATQKGQVEASTFGIYVASMEKNVIPLFGNMYAHLMDNQKVALLLNNYQGIHPTKNGSTQPDTSHLEMTAKLYGYTPEDGTPWKPNFSTHNKGGANLLLNNLKNFYYWSLEFGLIDDMPFTNQKLPHKKGARPYVSYLEIKPFLEAVRKCARFKDLELACRIGIFLGLRSDEIRRAEWWWISFDTCVFTPRDTKGRECEPIPIPPSLMKILVAEFTRRGEPLEDLLFPRVQKKVKGSQSTSSTAKPVTHRMRKRGQKRPESELRPKQFLNRVVASAGRAILKFGLSPHRLRATFATLHALAATPIRDIQAMLRHKHIGTTIGYIEDIPEIRHLAQARMEKLAGFGELGQTDMQNLRSWAEDLASFLRNPNWMGEDVQVTKDQEAKPDPRLILSELVVQLERLVGASKAA